MTRRPRFSPSIEALEARWVPATIRLLGGNLLVSNPSLVAGTSNITIKLVAAGTFQVTDGTKTVAVSGVSNILYTGTNQADSVTLDLNGQSFGGGFLARTGNGDDTVSVLSSSAGGAIRGNVTVQTGAGTDSVSINNAGGGSLAIGGSVRVVNTLGSDSLSMTGANATTIGGNLQATKVANVQIGQSGAVAIGGSLVVANDQLATPSNITVGGSNVSPTTVGGNVSISTGGAADTVVLGSSTLNIRGGTTQLSTGGGNDAVTLGSGGTTTIHGGLSLTEGDGDDTLTVNALFSGVTALQGDASVDLGQGNDNVNATIAPFTIDGSLSVTLGDGNDSMNISAAVIRGDLNIFAGGGNDTVTVGEAPGGRLTFQGGGGDDQLTLAPFIPDSAWDVSILFGTGSDTLNLMGGNVQILSGTIDFGGPLGGNTLNQQSNWLFDVVRILNI